MKTVEQLKNAMVSTNDVGGLMLLLSDAIATIEFEQSSKVFVQKRLSDAQAQIVRQTTMIDNLEKTLFARAKK